MTMWYIIVSFFLTMITYAQNQNSFTAGNDAYEQRDYQKAIACYESVDHKGYATWYNMACCFEYLNEPVRKLICLKRALSHASYAAFFALSRDIQILEKQLDKRTRIDGSWLLSVKTLVRYCHYHSSIYVMQMIFFLFWYSFLLLWYVRARSVLYRKLMKLLCASSLLITMGLIVQYKSKQYPQGIVTEQQVPVMVGPCQDYHVLGNLPIADQVHVLESRQEWCKVHHNSCVGWVKQGTIAVIE